jgi:hypothetical protein
MFKRFAPVAAMTVAAGSASAAVPESVTTALGDAATDGASVAGLVLVVIVGIAAFKYMQRAI